MRTIGQDRQVAVRGLCVRVSDSKPFDRKDVVHATHRAATEFLEFVERLKPNVVNREHLENATQAFGASFKHFQEAIGVVYGNGNGTGPRARIGPAHYRDLVPRTDKVGEAILTLFVGYETTMKKFHGMTDVWDHRVDSELLSLAISENACCYSWLLSALGKRELLDGPLTEELKRLGVTDTYVDEG